MSKEQPYSFHVEIVVQLSAIEGDENFPIQDFLLSPASISLAYPFLRQAVADITLKGRFGPVWMNVVNPALLVPRAPAGVAEPEV